MDLVILVVVYNLSPEESATLQSLSACCDFLKTHKHNIIIRDNSSKGYSQSQHNTLSQMLNGASFTYWHDGINLSLSEIYNSVITQQLKAEQILVIWDHDSQFTTDYFIKLAQAQTENKDCSLFLPIITNHDDIVSPSNVWGFKGSYWKHPQYGRLQAQNHTAINSGMAIRGEYLLHRFPGYDTHLKFYNTDNYFMWCYAQTEKMLVVLQTNINHQLNFYSPSESFSQQAARYSEMRSSAIYLAGLKSFWLKLLTYVYYDVFSIKLAYKRRDIRYALLR